MMDESYYPGTRVKVFDPFLFKDDKKTPLSVTMKPGTVTRWYGYRHPERGPYENLIDVRFDHRPDDISHGHFVNFAEIQYV